MTKPPQYTGTLRRGTAPGTVEGELRDRWGWIIAVVGTHTPGGGYALEGRLGETPAALRIEGFDEPAASE